MTETSPYNALVSDHFARPRNVGQLEAGPDVIAASAGRVEEGVQFHLSARISSGRIREVRVQVYGCPHSIAAASWLSEQLLDQSREALALWSWRGAAEALEVPPPKRGRLLILEDAVRALARAWV